MDVKIGDVVDVDVRPKLLAAKHGDLAAIHGVIGQDVDCKVQTQAGRVAANGCGPNRHGNEFVRRILGKDCFTFGLVPAVVGQWLQGMFFGDVGLVAYAVDAGAGGVDEPVDAAVLTDLDQFGKEIDL